MCDIRLIWRKVLCCFCGVIAVCAVRFDGASLPPDPSNAALLYYQAFLLRSEPNEVEKELVLDSAIDQIYEYLRGAPVEFDPNVESRLRQLETQLETRLPGSEEMTVDVFRNIMQLQDCRSERERQERLRDVDPARVIREYISRCREAIDLADAASELSECDWGIQHSKGIALALPQLTQLRDIGPVLRADALIHAADGEYQAALTRCLMMRRFAHHIGDDTALLHALSVDMDRLALGGIQTILGYMEPDAPALAWLKHRFAAESHPPFPPARRLRMDFAHVLQTVRNDEKVLPMAREATRLKSKIQTLLQEESEGVTGPEIEEWAEIMRLFREEPQVEAEHLEDRPDPNDLTDEELLALAAEPYAEFLEASLAVMEGDLPYRDKIAELKRLEEEIRNLYGDNPAAQRMMLTHPDRTLGLSIVIACMTDLAHVYERHVRHMAHVNAVMAGIDIHLVNARQGRLPETLPEGLPKDPFTGRDFHYERGEESFTLSPPDEAIRRDAYSSHRFKVRQGIR